MRGTDVRSDCWVQIEASGAPKINITSRVQAMYGDSIRATVRSTLAALGVSDLSVTIEDSGALPFTLMARIEAAVKRLRPNTTRAVLPDLNPAAQYASERQRLRRTRLYLPGNTPKFFINAGLHKPDAIILDLEDSVVPAEKDAARILVRNALRAVDFYGAEKMVRVNQLPRGLDDIRALAPHGVHVFLLPKVQDADEVREADRVISESVIARSEATKQHLHRTQVQVSPTSNFQPLISNIIPLIESARGVLKSFEIASASPRVVALSIGLEDYAQDIGAQRTAEGRESFWARGQVVNAARAAGVQPLASVFSDIADETGLRAYASEARALGFEGIGCLHPRQIGIAHDAFAPSSEEIKDACEIVLAFNEAKALGIGAIAVKDKMVDAPIVERARRTIRLACTLGRLPADWDARLKVE